MLCNAAFQNKPRGNICFVQAETALMCAADAGKEAGDWKLEQQALQGKNTVVIVMCQGQTLQVHTLERPTAHQQCLITHEHTNSEVSLLALHDLALHLSGVQSRTADLDRPGIASYTDTCADVGCCWWRWASGLLQANSATACSVFWPCCSS